MRHNIGHSNNGRLSILGQDKTQVFVSHQQEAFPMSDALGRFPRMHMSFINCLDGIEMSKHTFINCLDRNHGKFSKMQRKLGEFCFKYILSFLVLMLPAILAKCCAIFISNSNKEWFFEIFRHSFLVNYNCIKSFWS